ncbi:MAG: hypothetical protein IBX61_03310 [Thermoleophilia bacterium]|nr:hypothetical protein [Thermoleophilia bacterium]
MNAMMHSKIQTEPVRVWIATGDHEIDGYMHVKPGGYQSRISDVLNASDNDYIPVTEAGIRSLRNPQEQPRKADILILRLDTIKMVIPQAGRSINSMEAKAGSRAMPPMP